MEIKRDIYLNKLIKRKSNGLIKVITGICRCGKSYLLHGGEYPTKIVKDLYLWKNIKEIDLILICCNLFESEKQDIISYANKYNLHLYED